MSAEKYSFLNIGTAKGFRGDNGIIGSPNNGSFLGWVELLAEIDPFILEHVKNSKSRKRTSVLPTSDIGDDLKTILRLGGKKKIVEELKLSKFYFVSN